MTELPRHRLIQARKDAGFASPSEAARAHKRSINQNTLISHENGNREISRKAAEKYGAAFNVDPGWILFGGEEADPTRLNEEWASWEAALKESGQFDTAVSLLRALLAAGKPAEPLPAGEEKDASTERKAR